MSFVGLVKGNTCGRLHSTSRVVVQSLRKRLLFLLRKADSGIRMGSSFSIILL